MFKAAILVSFALQVLSLYSPNSNVVQLTSKNFDKYVLESDDVWIVEFYAPWCGYCQNFAPEYQKVANALKGVVKVGAVNVDEHRKLGDRYKIEGFPTVKIFALDKSKPEGFTSERNVKGVVNAAMKLVRMKVKTQLAENNIETEVNSTDIAVLTDDNFEDTVLKSEDMWIVQFYSPSCGHCMKLAPIWAEIATELKGMMMVGAIDATENKIISNKYNIEKYPSIKYFHNGEKLTKTTDYTGANTKADILSWALEKHLENLPAPDIFQIIDYKSFENACAPRKLCVVSFLPHILDCQSECRNSYLKTLKDTSEKFKNMDLGWVWTEGRVQLDLENALDVGGSGYPEMVVINLNKLKFSRLYGSFSEEGINEFLRDLSYGRRNSALMLLTDINIVETKAWDGKDEEPPQDNLEDVNFETKDEL